MTTHRGSCSYARSCRLLQVCSIASLILAVAAAPSSAQQHHYTNKTDFCNALGTAIQASSGAQMYCFGPQSNGPGLAAVRPVAPKTKGTANVDAADPAEDRTASGAYIGGQSETSIAASGNYVVEAWNDATGFFNGCPSPMYSEELTGYGFSSDGGVTFTDYGGLPNNNCATSLWSGDPSVGVYENSGNTYFYVSSLFSTVNGLQIAVAACQVTGNTLSCGQPTIVASSNNSFSISFLDKDYLTIDQTNKRLYIAFTDFADFVNPSGNTIQLAACDISNPLAPVCSNGNTTGVPPYLVVDVGDSVSFCEVEGAYPAIDPATGDIYVSFEYNIATNIFGSPACVNINPTKVVTALVRSSCLTNPGNGPSTCQPPFLENSNIIVSTDATVVPGYNRLLPAMNDFPRIAVSDAYGSVSVVWNDARNRPLGDIFLQSYRLGSLTYIQSSPTQLSDDDSTNRSLGAAFMPALKNVSGSGKLNVTWYDRRGSNSGTGKTDVFGATKVNPLTSRTPKNEKFTNVSTDWLATSTVIVPNFGDYTDNFVSSSNILYVAWSDGRTGVPQPEEANKRLHGAPGSAAAEEQDAQ